MTKATAVKWGNHTQATLQANYCSLQFGMFITYGIFNYNPAADGGTPPSTFNPGSTCSPAQWCDNAVAAGMKYCVLVAKHQMGHCLWPSAQTTDTIAHGTWATSGNYFDILLEFVTQCRAHKLAVIVYFSIWDQNFEVVNPSFTQAQYRTYLEAQITEILGGTYGLIDGLWLDGGYWHFSPNSYYPWPDYATMAAFIKGLQPNCLIINNSSRGITSDSDIVEFEMITGNGGTVGVPSDNTNFAETCRPNYTSNAWAHNPDDATKNVPIDTATLLALKAQILSRPTGKSNFLLNVPPASDGRHTAADVAMCAALGAG